MGTTVTVAGPVSMAKQWVAGLWTYYKGYTHSAIHAASAAALTIFGLLVFIDPLFAGVGIAAYVCPPVVLYVLGVDTGADVGAAGSSTRQVGTPSVSVTDSERESTHATRDSNHDDADSDSDSDSDDGDSDSDGGDGDSDSDGADRDRDSDGDDGDSDADGTDTDSDADS